MVVHRGGELPDRGCGISKCLNAGSEMVTRSDGFFWLDLMHWLDPVSLVLLGICRGREEMGCSDRG